MRAFLVGAITGMRGSYASLGDLANPINRDQYKNELGRGRSKLLTQEQKDQIIALVISTRNNCKQELWQAIVHGVFNHIVPEMSITTFET